MERATEEWQPELLNRPIRGEGLLYTWYYTRYCENFFLDAVITITSLNLLTTPCYAFVSTWKWNSFLRVSQSALSPRSTWKWGVGIRTSTQSREVYEKERRFNWIVEFNWISLYIYTGRMKLKMDSVFLDEPSPWIYSLLGVYSRQRERKRGKNERRSEERIKEDTVGTRKTDGFIILLRHRERATPTSHETMKRVTGI